MNAPVALDIRGLHKAYGSNVVLDGVDLQLRTGELLGIFGHSGSGKSVLLRSLIGLERPDSGQIFFEGLDLASIEEREFSGVRRDIGYVFQNGALFTSMTIEENLAYPLQLHTDWDENRIHETVNARLEQVGLSGTNELFPDEISGGMTKRAGLLRGTMLSPKITLFDEPTSGLDPMNVRIFARTVRQLKQAATMTGLFITHDINCAHAVCDRIGILYQGRIHALDTVANFWSSSDPVVRSFIETDYSKPDPLEASERSKGGRA